MYIWDTVVDVFTTSDNERKRDEYKKLVNYLNKKIPKAEELYDELVKSCETEFNIMEGSKGDASGVLASMYDEKFEIYQEDTEKLLNYYKSILSSFRSKLSTAQSKYEYYVEQCRIEDELRRQRIREEREREEREKREERERRKEAEEKTKTLSK
jgi:hypothetical protein